MWRGLRRRKISIFHSKREIVRRKYHLQFWIGNENEFDFSLETHCHLNFRCHLRNIYVVCAFKCAVFSPWHANVILKIGNGVIWYVHWRSFTINSAPFKSFCVGQTLAQDTGRRHILHTYVEICHVIRMKNFGGYY